MYGLYTLCAVDPPIGQRCVEWLAFPEEVGALHVFSRRTSPAQQSKSFFLLFRRQDETVHSFKA